MRPANAPLAPPSNALPPSPTSTTPPPILICLLGNLRVLKAGRLVAVCAGSKAEALLRFLALNIERRVPRESLLAAVWPNIDPGAGSQSLNSLVYHLQKLLGDALDGEPVIVHADGYYRLNVDRDVAVDIARFDAFADRGDTALRAADPTAAAQHYRHAVALYRGDLNAGSDMTVVVERERLRARYLTLLARLADHAFAAGDLAACLGHAQRLLTNDPCREDAHRLIMLCHIRRGERAAALRQYRICCEILRAEFDAPPETATTALFDHIRLNRPTP